MNFLSSSKSMKAFSVQLNKYFKYGSGIIYGTKTKAETPSRSFRSVGASHPIPRLYHSIYLNYGSKRDRIKVLKLVIDRSFWGQMENAHGRGIFSPFHVVILFTHSLVSNSLWPLGLQRTRLPCPLLSSRVCSNSCPLSQWCHPTISSCFPLFFLSSIFPSIKVFSNELALCIGDQSIGASVSVLAMNIQGWYPLRLTGFIS